MEKGFEKGFFEDALKVARMSMKFGLVERATRYADGVTPESDTDHTFMVGLLSCALAERIDPTLDRGKVSMLALVHDLVEVYAGDTPTLRHMTADEVDDKALREAEALERIKREFDGSFPWISSMVGEYESLESREARFVKVVDKIVPKFTHALNGGITVKETFLPTGGDLKLFHENQRVQIERLAVEWPDLIRLWEEGCEATQAVVEKHDLQRQK